MVDPDFKQIDATAYAADRVYDVGLLRDAQDNVNECHTKRGRMAACHFGDIDSSNNRIIPRVCSFRQRAYLLYPYLLSAGVTDLEVVLRHTTPSAVTGGGAEMIVDVLALPIDAILGGRAALPEATGAATVDLSNSATAVNTSLTVDVSEMKGWIVVLVGFESGEDATPDLLDTVATGKGPDVFVGWSYGYVNIDSTVDSSIYSASEIPCQGMLYENKTSGDDDGRLPGPRQIISVELLSTGDFRLYTYPGFTGRSSDLDVFDGADDQAYKVDLGYLDLYSVTIRDKTISDLPGMGSAQIDASRPSSVLHPQGIYRNAVDVWAQKTRIHAIGQTHDPGDEDSDYSGRALSLMEARANLPTNLATWQTLARCVVGDEEQYTYAGSTYTRTGYTVEALVMVTHPARRGGKFYNYSIDWRVQLVDLDGSTSSAVSSTYKIPMLTHGIKETESGTEGAAVAAYLRGFTTRGDYATYRRHALRGLIPADAMNTSRIERVAINVTDDQNTDYRILRLQCVGVSGKTDGGQQFGTLPTVHLLSWAVVTAKVEDAATAATAMGVV